MDHNSKRSRFPPDYLLFVTNVRLSADDATGGVDQIREFIAKQSDRNHGPGSRPDTLRARGLRDVKVWHRDSLNSLISNNQSISRCVSGHLDGWRYSHQAPNTAWLRRCRRLCPGPSGPCAKHAST
jgi:hypothetical protein